jgi:hypothetical protein
MYALVLLLAVMGADVSHEVHHPNRPIVVVVDKIELNHYYNGPTETVKHDTKVFTQLIFWEFSSNKKRHNVIDWDMVEEKEVKIKIGDDGTGDPREKGEKPDFVVKKYTYPDNIPYYSSKKKMYKCSFMNDGRRYWVYSKVYVITNTYFDPEFEDRSVLPKDMRRKLPK